MVNLKIMYRIKCLNCVKNGIVGSVDAKKSVPIIQAYNFRFNSSTLKNSNQNVFHKIVNLTFYVNKAVVINSLKMNDRTSKRKYLCNVAVRDCTNSYSKSNLEVSRVNSLVFNNNTVINKKYCEFYKTNSHEDVSHIIQHGKQILMETYPNRYYVRVPNKIESSAVIARPQISDQCTFRASFCTYGVTKCPSDFVIAKKGMDKNGSSTKVATNVVRWLKGSFYVGDCGNLIWNKKTISLFQNKRSQFRAYCSFKRESPKNLSLTALEVEKIKSLFPTPKNTLHNYFKLVSDELNNQDLIVEPKYKFIKKSQNVSSWTCTYNLKWPEQKKISDIGATKQEASHKAALLALAWLKQINKINSSGTLEIYDSNDFNSITQRSHSILTIKDDIKEKLQNISDIYQNRLAHLMNPKLDEMRLSENEEPKVFENEWPEMQNIKQLERNDKGLNFYLAREPVKLPISNFKENIIEKLSNQVVIIKGEPGCGKSTRVPQYVLETWAKEENFKKPCKICITQPRRIAAISLAERIANEREERVGSTVGYQVRLKSNFNNKTGRILFCTTGILLRRLQSDPKLSDCTHVILDEAHERDVNTDLLMNLLKEALKLNRNLKLLVMSATIDVRIFQDYFDGAPVLHIPGFTYPVEEHFLGSNDNSGLSKTSEMCASNHPAIIHEDVAKMIQNIHKNKSEGAILCFLSGWDDIIKVRNLITEKSNLLVLCLHSRLEVSDQQRIFAKPPHGIRKVILSTNIAETSITIDDVVYVIDTGIHKEERFNSKIGAMCIDNRWISKASATQRKGRAGRCQAGECYHLYPKSKHLEMESYSTPEILRTSLTKIVLDSKVYSNNMKAVEFLDNLICPPDTSAVTKAIVELKELEMLDNEENLTPLGRTASEFQMAPKLSKAMINSVIFKCVTPVVDIATMFSSETAIFSKDLMDKENARSVKSNYHNSSDHLALMLLLEEWIALIEEQDIYEAKNFCSDTGLISHKMHTLKKLRNIHFEYLTKGLKPILPIISDNYSDNSDLILAVLLSGVGTVLQHRNWDIVKGRLKKSNVFLTRHKRKATITSESVNCKKNNFSSNVLLHINETISNLRHTTLVRETSVISPLAYLLFKNGVLQMEKIPEELFSSKIPSNNQVLLSLEESNLKFLCDHSQAITIKNCKESLRACVQYYVYKLTTGGQCNSKINEHWQNILEILNLSLTK